VHTAPKKWKQRVQSSYVNVRTLASIYLASLSNAYRHAYRARSMIQPVEEEGRKMKWKNSLPQALSRYHFQAACMRDWCRLCMH